MQEAAGRLQESFDEPVWKDRRIGCDPTGNWCGHIKDAPRFFYGKDGHKTNRPYILEWAKQGAEKYYNRPDIKLLAIRATRATKRRQRSEGREAVVLVLQVLFHFTELASLRFLIPKSHGNNFYPSMRFIANHAGIGLKRVQRAVSVLKKAGYLQVIERFDKDGDDFKGLAAVKRLLPQAFKACGVGLQKLSAHRKLARKKLNKAYNMRIQRMQDSLASNLSIKIFRGDQNAKVYLNQMRSYISDEACASDKEIFNDLIRLESKKIASHDDHES